MILNCNINNKKLNIVKLFKNKINKLRNLNK